MIKHTIRRATVVGVLCVIATLVAAGESTPLGDGVLTELTRTDLDGNPSMEVILSSYVLKPGGSIPRHTHPGDELYTVVQGSTLTTPDGKIFEVSDGSATSNSRDKIHGGVTNTGDRDFVLITVHIVDKDKPRSTLVE